MDRVVYESLGRAWSPRSPDDRLEALAMALAYWVESMSRDFEEATAVAMNQVTFSGRNFILARKSWSRCGLARG